MSALHKRSIFDAISTITTRIPATQIGLYLPAFLINNRKSERQEYRDGQWQTNRKIKPLVMRFPAKLENAYSAHLFKATREFGNLF